MCNLHWCYTFCTVVTLFALVLHLNCTALSQSESSNFFMYIIRSVIILVINKLDSRFAIVQFCFHSYDYRPNWTPISPITITNQVWFVKGFFADICLLLRSFDLSSRKIIQFLLVANRVTEVYRTYGTSFKEKISGYKVFPTKTQIRVKN